MSALLDSFAAGFQGDAARRAALDAALRDGLPHARSEAWKYTSLRALERRSFAPADESASVAVDPRLLDGIPAPRLVFVNGAFDAAHSDLSGLPPGVRFAARADAPQASAGTVPTTNDAVFARVNAALAHTGLLLEVADGVEVALPLQLVCIGAAAGGDRAWHLRHRIDVGAGARVELVEHQLADGAHRHLDNSALELVLAADAGIRHVRIQATADGATGFLRTDASLQARARYERVDLELGGGLVRHELNVRLLGDEAALTANGVLLATGRRHLETRLGIEHHGRDTRCGLLWRGIGGGRGRVVFHGGITIHAGADGTDARLSNKNLLLSTDAEIDTQPVLVIHADEVQAAHGATVGQLDANALFYLRARGLPLAEAQRLLTAAFVREPMSPVGDGPLHARLQQRLDQALEGLAPA